MKQAEGIRQSLAKDGIKTPADKEVIALIAYMQRLGTDISRSQTAQNQP
jgi:cytochrome c oxidase cbb3-type subunit I/II